METFGTKFSKKNSYVEHKMHLFHVVQSHFEIAWMKITTETDENVSIQSKSLELSYLRLNEMAYKVSGIATMHAIVKLHNDERAYAISVERKFHVKRIQIPCEMWKSRVLATATSCSNCNRQHTWYVRCSINYTTYTWSGAPCTSTQRATGNNAQCTHTSISFERFQCTTPFNTHAMQWQMKCGTISNLNY